MFGSYGKYKAKDHEAGGAIDFSFEKPDDANAWKETIEGFDFFCEYHFNSSSRIAYSYIEGKTHLHCTSKEYAQSVFDSIGDIYFTSYNPEAAQTDSTPCVAGGTGYNLCNMAKEGKRIIALSQDLVTWTGRGIVSAGTIVELKSSDYPNDPRCNGEFIVSDSMNVRYEHRGDIFMMDRKDNTSCNAKITIL